MALLVAVTTVLHTTAYLCSRRGAIREVQSRSMINVPPSAPGRSSGAGSRAHPAASATAEIPAPHSPGAPGTPAGPPPSKMSRSPPRSPLAGTPAATATVGFEFRLTNSMACSSVCMRCNGWCCVNGEVTRPLLPPPSGPITCSPDQHIAGHLERRQPPQQVQETAGTAVLRSFF